MSRIANRMEFLNVDHSALMKRLLKLETKIDKALDGKQSLEALVTNKLIATEAIVDKKLLVLGHYDIRMGNLDNEIADARRVMHSHRDELKVDSYKARELISRLEDLISHEADKSSAWMTQDRQMIQKSGNRIGEIEK